MKHAMEVNLIMAPLNTRLKTAQRIAADASPVAMALFRKPLSITAKSDDSPVTIADQNTEKAIRAALEISFPGETAPLPPVMRRQRFSERSLSACLEVP